MLYNLKEYQREAVDEIKDYFNFNFNKNNKNIVFKSPTGSGKTLMLSTVIEELVQERSDDNFSFVWVSIGKGELQKQSYESVTEYVCGHPKCTLLEESFFGSREYIKKHEVVFVNWEKLISKDKETGKWKNNLMQDKEGKNFLDIIDRTKENGTKIILIVDESHIGANSGGRIAEFKDTVLLPDMTIEMSATPMSNPDISVDPQKVIDEGIIKKDIIVNEGILKGDISNEDKDSEILVLEKAEKKRQEIIEQYKKVGVNVNPLVLVQIPNTDAGESKKLVVKDFLRDLGIVEEDGRLKQWCDNKGNFDKKLIKKNDDETCYLIFKTAVATGWDCPRAHILVKFREGHSETFEIQTIGRILRTAEAKAYDDEILDNAYIFTNIKEFETTKDTYNPNRLKTEFSYLKKGYTKESVWEATRLESFYRSREGAYNSADSRFVSYFEKEFMQFFELSEENKYTMAHFNVAKFQAKGMNLDVSAKELIVSEFMMNSIYADYAKKYSGDTTVARMSENDIQAAYYSIIKSNLNGLAYIRSKSPINTAIIDVVSKFYNAFSRKEKVLSIQKIVVQNAEIFSALLDRATNKFRMLLQQDMGLTGKHYEFKIEDKRGYSIETHTKLDLDKSLYQPLHVLKESDTGKVNGLEKNFLEHLNQLKEVEWFWENGQELMQINFGVPYNKGMNTFQPDFIVKFSNGDVGIFDTKPIAHNVEDTKKKAEALQKYISHININRGDLPRVIGGIVVQKGKMFYYNCNDTYHDIAEDSSKWKTFNSLIEAINVETEAIKYLSK